IPLCALLLLLSGSVTAAAITIALLVGILLVPVLRWPASRLIAFGVAVTALAIPTVLWVFQNADSVLRALGKETHLTGRLPLWALVRAEIATMPILGHGYAAFWSTAESDRFRQALNWDVMNAHNGFLEMMLGLGVVGLILFVIGLIRNIYLGFVVARAGDTLDQAWPLFFLAFALLWDVTDSALFAGNSIMWLLYTTNAFWLVSTAAELRAEKRARYAPANQEPEFAST
ncbi:MAG: O-antigen ligase family protein, partial [Candidatus Acidiferrales bacterium]